MDRYRSVFVANEEWAFFRRTLLTILLQAVPYRVNNCMERRNVFRIDRIIFNDSATESFRRVIPGKMFYKGKRDALNRSDISSRRQTLVCIPDKRMNSCRLATPAEYSCWYLVSTSLKSIDPPYSTSASQYVNSTSSVMSSIKFQSKIEKRKSNKISSKVNKS